MEETVPLEYDATCAVWDAYEREMRKEQVYERVLQKCLSRIRKATMEYPPKYSVVFTVPKSLPDFFATYDYEGATEFVIAALRDRDFRVSRIAFQTHHFLYITWVTREHLQEKQRLKERHDPRPPPSDPEEVRQLRERRRRRAPTQTTQSAVGRFVQPVEVHKDHIANLIKKLQ
jgi:hypothetical protein